MAQRACGYCRDIGHQRPKCPMLHEQRRGFHDHIKNETLKVYRFLCSIGLGPNALVDANVLNWGPRHHKEPLLAQILPYDYQVEQRYYHGDTYKTVFTERIVNSLYRCKNVKYSKQIKITHMRLEDDSIYAELPLLLLDGSNNVKTYSVNTHSLYQRSMSVPVNRYAAAEGKQVMEKVFVCPSNDCPDIILPNSMLNPTEEFYPLRIQL